MTSNYIIKDNISIIYELIRTFYYLANEDYLVDSFNKSFERDNLDIDKYKNSSLKNFYKFIEKFKKLNLISKDDLDFYFKGLSDGKIYTEDCLASLLLANLEVNDIELLKSNLQMIDADNLEKILIKIITNSLDGDFYPYSNIQNISKADFMKYLISNSNLNSESKWLLTVIVEDGKNRLLTLLDILLNSLDEFISSFKILESDLNKFALELKNDFIKDSEFLNKLSGFNFEWSETLTIYPSMVNFKSITINSNTENLPSIPKRDCCYLGWRFKNLIELNKNRHNNEELLQDKLKCISDKSKFSIIKLLKDKPMYGQQIAENLSLTTATISHHMNALVLCKLVSITKVDNRVYYNLVPSEIESIITSLKEQFL